jgi:hypothetical protein
VTFSAALAASDDVLPARRVGYLYINMMTGERAVTPYIDRSGPAVWANDDTTIGSFFMGVDRPTRATTDARPRFGASINTIGDIAGTVGVGTTIDGISIAHAVSGIKSTNTTAHECAGFDAVLFFYDNDNATGSTPDSRAQPIASFTITDLPGEEGTGNAWEVTIDLTGGNEFALGDQDLDGDGKLDFGWGMTFIQGQSLTDGINTAKGIAGPTLALPGNIAGSTSTSSGVPNRLHWYSALTFDASGSPQDRSHQTFLTSTGSANYTPGTPYTEPFLVLSGGSCTCAADFNGDGFLDFTDFDDFDDFVVAFEAGDPVTDFNSDGFLDFTDFDDFVAAFETSC